MLLKKVELTNYLKSGASERDAVEKLQQKINTLIEEL